VFVSVVCKVYLQIVEFWVAASSHYEDNNVLVPEKYNNKKSRSVRRRKDSHKSRN
jgi:hypothetical protein